jgi:serine acetyltransferase
LFFALPLELELVLGAEAGTGVGVTFGTGAVIGGAGKVADSVVIESWAKLFVTFLFVCG